MDEAYFGQKPKRNQFSKFVDEIPPDELVEIPLSSDGENEVDDFSSKAKCSPISIQPVFPSRPTSKSEIQEFFEPAYSPSHITSDSASTQYFENSNNDDDIEDDLKFNEELANSIRHQCSLFSPSLVHAINSDIMEIKRSLNANKREESLQDLDDEHDRLVKCHRHERNGGQRKSRNPSRYIRT